MEENRGRLQQLLVNGWGLATAPLYRNAIFIMSSTVVGAGLGFFFYLIIARFYTVSDLGYAQGLFNSISFLATVALLGLGVALVRFLPEAENKAPMINTCLTVTGLVALPLSVIFIVGIGFWLPSLNFIFTSPIYWIAIVLATLSVTFAPILDQSGLAMRRGDLIFWRTLVASALKIPMAATFVLVPATGGRLDIFLSISLPLGIAVVLEGAVLLPRVLKGYRPRPSFDLAHIRPMFRFSTGNYLAATIGGADTLLLVPLIIGVLGGSGGPLQAGYFQIATVVAALLGVIPSAMFASFYAESSQKHATPENRHRDERKAILLTLGILLPAILVLWYSAGFMLGFFGGAAKAAYVSGSIDALHILIFGSIPGFLNSILTTRVLIRKQTKPLIVAAIISTSVTLGFGYIFLLLGGIAGLAIAAVIGAASQTPYLYLVARKSLRDESGPPVVMGQT